MKNNEQDVAFDTTDLDYNKDPQREMRSTIWMLIVMLIVLLAFVFIIPNFVYEALKGGRLQLRRCRGGLGRQ